MRDNLHKSKIIFRKNADPPSSEKTDKYKNFGKVLSRHSAALRQLHRRPLYKNPKFLLGILLLIVIAWLVFRAVDEEKEERDPRPASDKGMMQSQPDTSAVTGFFSSAEWGDVIT